MRPIIEASQGKRRHGLPGVARALTARGIKTARGRQRKSATYCGEVGARSVRWLGVGAHHSSRPNTRDKLVCSPSHGENRGSSPLGSASDFNELVKISGEGEMLYGKCTA